IFHAGVRQTVTARGLNAGGEEILHLEQALRGLDILAGNGPAYGRFVHPHDLGYLNHGQWFEERDPLFHELALTAHDFTGDVENGLLALVQALDEKFSRANFFTD